jgi:hypothetical protein
MFSSSDDSSSPSNELDIVHPKNIDAKIKIAITVTCNYWKQ